MAQRNNCMQGGLGQNGCCPNWRSKGIGNEVNITNSICVTQTATANGGDGGDGGSNGSATSSVSASAAAADRGGVAVINTQQSSELELSSDEELAETSDTDEESTLQTSSASASASNGSTTNGSAGSGGNGGNGGSASNTVSAEINNAVVLMYNGGSDSASYSVGLNDKKLDIKIDEDGSVYVNGTKLEEAKLDDGTKLFVFTDKKANS